MPNHTFMCHCKRTRILMHKNRVYFYCFQENLLYCTSLDYFHSQQDFIQNIMTINKITLYVGLAC